MSRVVTTAVCLAVLAPRLAHASDDSGPSSHLAIAVGPGGTSLLPFPAAMNVDGRLSWQPTHVLGLAADLEAYTVVVIPFGGAVRVGPVLRAPWTNGTSPYLMAQIGVMGWHFMDDDFSAREMRAEIGVDLLAGKRLVITVGAGASAVHNAQGDQVMGFGHVLFGAYF
jgi:hypothetical protein